MITALFFIIGAILASIGAVGAIISYLRSRHEALKYLALVFVLMSLHAYAFSVPFLINHKNLTMIAYGYTIGVGFIFVLMLLGLRVQMFLTQKFIKIYGNLLGIIIAIIGVIVLTLQVYDLRLPLVTENGIIFWNANVFASVLTAVTFFVYGAFWTYVFYLASNITRGFYEKIKLLILSADGLLFGSGAVLIYTSFSNTQSVVGLTLLLIACIITVPIVILPKRKAIR
jgi:hypothetical protein